MKKGIKRAIFGILGFVVVLVVVIVVAVAFYLGPIVKRGVESMGPKIIGVPCGLETSHIRPLAGIVKLEGVTVGNPAGYKSDYAFHLNSLKVNVDVGSVFTDVIVIKEIVVSGPRVVYELKGRGSNIGTILDRVRSDTKPGDEAPATPTPAAEDAGPAKRVIIEKFVFEEGTIEIAAAILGGQGASIPLPRLELKDVGARSGGATVVDVTTDVVSSVMMGVVKAVMQSGGALAKAGVDLTKAAASLGLDGIGAAALLGGDVAGAALDVTGAAAGAAAQGVGVAADAAVDLAEGAAGAAADAVGATVDVAADAAGAAGKAAVGGVKAVGDGVGKALGGLGGLLGGKDEKKREE